MLSKMPEKVLRLRDKTNELGDFVARLKEKSEESIKWADLDVPDTVSDFPKLTLEELNELTLENSCTESTRCYTR
ncbi:unnamed protein product [Rotaria sp. Silwood1]|nr:unnamed protein product [Rotaria sp. Silwood1]